MQMSVKYFLFWLPMIAIAFINAGIRETILVRKFEPLHAHQISTLTLILLCACYIWLIYPFLRINNITSALLAGAVWMILTILFEFSMGFALKKPLSTILSEYDLTSGKLWPVFLVVLFIMPLICYTIRK